MFEERLLGDILASFAEGNARETITGSYTIAI
jgi:hypothetical protein